MSTIKSSNEHLTINADGSSKDIKFQANGVEKASISSAGAFTSTTIDATKLTGALPAISGAALTGVGVAGISSSADATAITIDSSERVGIGAGSPLTKLQIQNGTNDYTSGILLSNGSGASEASSIWHDNSGNTSLVLSNMYDNAGGSIKFNCRENGTAVTPLQVLADGRGLSSFTAKSWCNVNMSAGAFNDHHNHDSLTDVGTGAFVLSFTVNMNDSTYVVVSSNPDGYNSGYTNLAQDSFRGYNYDMSSTKVDQSQVCFAVFGN